MKNGKGIVTYPDGNRLETTWTKNKKEGDGNISFHYLGVLYLTNGSKESKRFANDQEIAS